MTVYTVKTNNIEETETLGTRCGKVLQKGDTFCLQGTLGAGKTAFTRGIARGWGITVPITSPTFSLVHEYRKPDVAVRLYHLDCYRLGSHEETWSLGIDDILNGEHIVVIEWPERIQALLAEEIVWVTIDIQSDSERLFEFKITSPQYVHLVQFLTSIDGKIG